MPTNKNAFNPILTAILSLIIIFQGMIIYLGPERVYNALVKRVHYYLGSGKSDGIYVPVNVVLSETQLTKDPLSKYQWGLKMMLDGATYQEIQGDAHRDVVVAVIDRGVHMDHPDLRNKRRGGWNFIDGTDRLQVEYDARPPNGSIAHGECAASIIAAEVDNNVGIAGVFSRAYIMPLQSNGHIAEAVSYAIDHNADVILIAGGAGNDDGEWLFPMYQNPNPLPPETGYSPRNLKKMAALRDALQKAYEKNIPVITGVGNTKSFGMTFVADDHTTIAAAPHNVFGQVSVHTSFSYSFEVFAPGGSRKKIENLSELARYFPEGLKVFSPTADFDDPLCAIGTDNSYSFLTLGSGAMPNVAGAVAMIKSYLPDITVEEVRQILRKSSISLKPGGSLLEGLGGRLSLRLLRQNIDHRLEQDLSVNHKRGLKESCAE
jgi:subtilisin family serine protease